MGAKWDCHLVSSLTAPAARRSGPCRRAPLLAVPRCQPPSRLRRDDPDLCDVRAFSFAPFRSVGSDSDAPGRRGGSPWLTSPDLALALGSDRPAQPHRRRRADELPQLLVALRGGKPRANDLAGLIPSQSPRWFALLLPAIQQKMVTASRASRLLRSAAAAGSSIRRAARRLYATEALSSPLEPGIMIPYAKTSANIKLARDRCVAWVATNVSVCSEATTDGSRALTSSRHARCASRSAQAEPTPHAHREDPLWPP